MENLEKTIEIIIQKRFQDTNMTGNLNCEMLKREVMNEIVKYHNKNLSNLLDFCEIIEKEKNGLLFIKKMIRNLIV